MKAFEIIQVLTKGIFPVDRCGTSKFSSSDLSELAQLFGTQYSWTGHMFQGNVFYIYHEKTDDWVCEDWDLCADSLSGDGVQIYVFQVMEDF